MYNIIYIYIYHIYIHIHLCGVSWGIIREPQNLASAGLEANMAVADLTYEAARRF